MNPRDPDGEGVRGLALALAGLAIIALGCALGALALAVYNGIGR